MSERVGVADVAVAAVELGRAHPPALEPLARHVARSSRLRGVWVLVVVDDPRGEDGGSGRKRASTPARSLRAGCLRRELGTAPRDHRSACRRCRRRRRRPETDTATGLRDRALLLVGFALGLRRSELVALNVEDLSPSPDGLTVRLPKSKTDQAGHGTQLLLAYARDANPCPVRSLRAWRDHAGITEGALFRRVTRTGVATTRLSDKSVALIVKKRAHVAGINAADLAGHSLRSGFATQAARDGHHTAQIADVTRHRDRRVLDGYIQAGRGAEHIARVL